MAELHCRRCLPSGASKANPVLGGATQPWNPQARDARTNLKPGCVHVEIQGINHASMRNTQFWILLLGSTLVSGLLIKQIFLSHALNQEQSSLVDSQETASSGPAFENTWKQLAIHIYQASRQDPVLVDVLKNNNITIHMGPPSGAGSAPATAPSAPTAPSKTPASPPHPAAP